MARDNHHKRIWLEPCVFFNDLQLSFWAPVDRAASICDYTIEVQHIILHSGRKTVVVHQPENDYGEAVRVFELRKRKLATMLAINNMVTP